LSIRRGKPPIAHSGRRHSVQAAPPGKRISARHTFFLKRVFPVLWFGFIALFLATALLAGQHGRPLPPPAYVVPLLLLVIGYALMRRLVFDLADEVFDEGDALRVRIGHEEERVPLADIINVSYAGMTSPPRVTLTLRSAGRFGKELTFAPQQGLLGPLFRKNPLVDDLIERVDAARRQ
jgi:hypothetical protein